MHSDPAPSARQLAGREILITILAGLSLGAAVIWWVNTAPTPSSRRPAVPGASIGYAGSRACGECHPGESAAFARSGHARTLRLASESPLAWWLDGKSFKDPERPGVQWNYAFDEAEGLSVERVEGGKTERIPIEFAIGSGHHATTFVTITNDTPGQTAGIEHRLTYYADGERMGITPGQSRDALHEGTTATGRLLDNTRAFKCFSCHTTITSERSGPVLDLATMIPNVTCERCHGPAARHVDLARRGAADELLKMPNGIGNWTTESQLQLCGRCHRLPEMAPKGELNPENAEMARFQPPSLMQSDCFQKSNGELSCVTCHDPHARASDDLPRYVGICLSCHGAKPEQTRCSVSPSEGCIECHMPRRDAGQGILFSDHWIRIHRRPPPGAPAG